MPGWTCARCSSTLCREANLALGGDLAGVYLGDAKTGGLAVAGDGIPPYSDWYGYVIRPGEGVGGQVLVTGEPAVSNSYGTDAQIPESDVLRPIQTAVAVPVSWDGQLKGALSIGFLSMRRVTDEDIAVATGDSRPGGGGVEQRGGLRARPGGRAHRLAHRPAQPRRGARADP